jgi:peptidoglycan/LPS O-acetylase OafA/YrhL
MKVNEIILLKFIAIILITNSHLNGYYPVSYFSTGGSLGNSIFFLVSAIGLTFSLDKKVINFSSWYKKRFIRIYPTMWLAITVFILVGLFNFESYYEIRCI